ncbi:hypothetical protein [Cupriavidus campinensis]|uniref:hypothetical protein n=1 Tax=Cupriavidus campinensis TaxID=151783 RepID=UPI0021CC502E|nr:hypothetical protein [Cupriavidus campinensis]
MKSTLPRRWCVSMCVSIGLAGAATPGWADEPVEAVEGAASAEEKQDWIDRILTKLGASDAVDVSQGIDWGVLPGPFYNPEMGFGIGAAAIGLYKPANAAQETQLSTLSIRGFGTVKGAYGISIENNTFFADDSYRFLIEADLINMPTAYWGIGYGSAIDSANKEAYTRKEVVLQPKIMMRVRPNVYVGRDGACSTTTPRSWSAAPTASWRPTPTAPACSVPGLVRISRTTRGTSSRTPTGVNRCWPTSPSTAANSAAIRIWRTWNSCSTSTSACASAMCWPSTPTPT